MYVRTRCLWGILALTFFVGVPKAFAQKMGYFGSRLRQTNDALEVVALLPGSLEQRLGLLRGDKIHSVNRVRVRSSSELQKALVNQRRFTIEFTRSGRRKTLTAQLYWPPRSFANQLPNQKKWNSLDERYRRPPIVIQNRIE